MAGITIHLAIWARPDLVYSVSVLGPYVHNQTRTKNGEYRFLWMSEPRGQARVRLLNKLDKAYTNADDRMMLVRHHSGNELALIWTDFLIEQRRVTDVVEITT